MASTSDKTWQLLSAEVQRAVRVTGMFEHAFRNSGLNDVQLNQLFEASPGDLGLIWNALIEAGRVFQQPSSSTSLLRRSTPSRIPTHPNLTPSHPFDPPHRATKPSGNRGGAANAHLSFSDSSTQQPSPCSRRGSQDFPPQQSAPDHRAVNPLKPKRIHVPPNYERSPNSRLRERQLLPQILDQNIKRPGVDQQLGRNRSIAEQGFSQHPPNTELHFPTYPQIRCTSHDQRQDNRQSSVNSPQVHSTALATTPTSDNVPSNAQKEPKIGFTSSQIDMVSLANRENLDFNLCSFIESSEAGRTTHNEPVASRHLDTEARPPYGTSRNPVDEQAIIDLIGLTGLDREHVTRVLRYTNGDVHAAADYMMEERIPDDPPHLTREIPNFRRVNPDADRTKKTDIPPFRLVRPPVLVPGLPISQQRNDQGVYVPGMVCTGQNIGAMQLASTTRQSCIFDNPIYSWHGQATLQAPRQQLPFLELPMPASAHPLSHQLINQPVGASGPTTAAVQGVLNRQELPLTTLVYVRNEPVSVLAEQLRARFEQEGPFQPQGTGANQIDHSTTPLLQSSRYQSEPPRSTLSYRQSKVRSPDIFRAPPVRFTGGQTTRNAEAQLRDTAVSRSSRLSDGSDSAKLEKRMRTTAIINPGDRLSKKVRSEDVYDTEEASDGSHSQSRVSMTRGGRKRAATEEGDEDYRAPPARGGNRSESKDQQPARKPRCGRGSGGSGGSGGSRGSRGRTRK